MKYTGTVTDSLGNDKLISVNIEDITTQNTPKIREVSEESSLNLFEQHLKKVDSEASIQFLIDTTYNRYEYSIKTEGKIYTITSSSELGAQSGGVFLLRELEIYLFTPHELWHIYPESLTEVSIAKTSPSFTNKFLFLTYGYGSQADPNWKPFKDFRYLTGMDQTDGNIGHAWGNIINRNSLEFSNNPNLYENPAEADNPEGNRNLNIVDNGGTDSENHAQLIDLVQQDRIRLLEENRLKNPEISRIPLDPKDGSLFTTDEVVSFNNQICKALASVGGSGGMYAYAGHRLPPTIKCEDNLHVQVALGFNRTELTYDELIEGWGSKCQNVGLREYWSVPIWDAGLPSKSKFFKPQQTAEFYKKHNQNNNTTFIRGEATAFWPAFSLGYFVYSSILEYSELDVEELKKTYHTKLFEDNQYIKELFELWETKRDFTAHLAYKSLQLLNSALIIADSDKVRQRIKILIDYLFLSNLFRKLGEVEKHSMEYFDLLEKYMRYVWTYRDSMTVHYYALARMLCNTNVTNSDRYDLYIFRKKHEGLDPVWQVDSFITPQNLKDMLSELTEETKFTNYSENLVIRQVPKGVPREEEVLRYRRFRGDHRFYSTKDSVLNFLKIDGNPVLRVNGEIIEDDELFTMQENSFFTVSGGMFEMELVSGALAVNCSPENPAWIDNVGSRLWGFSDKEELHIDGSPRSTTIHLVDNKLVRHDVTKDTREIGKNYSVIKTPLNQVYEVHHINQRGTFIIYNQPQWLSFDRNQIILPEEVNV